MSIPYTLTLNGRALMTGTFAECVRRIEDATGYLDLRDAIAHGGYAIGPVPCAVDHPCYGVHVFDCDGTTSGHDPQVQACEEAGRFDGPDADDEAAVALIHSAERGEDWALAELRTFLKLAARLKRKKVPATRGKGRRSKSR